MVSYFFSLSMSISLKFHWNISDVGSWYSCWPTPLKLFSMTQYRSTGLLTPTRIDNAVLKWLSLLSRFFTHLKLLHFVPFILNFCLRILLKQYLTSFSKKSYFRSRIKFPILFTYTIYSISKRLVMVYGCCCLSIRSIDSILALIAQFRFTIIVTT